MYISTICGFYASTSNCGQLYGSESINGVLMDTSKVYKDGSMGFRML